MRCFKILFGTIVIATLTGACVADTDTDEGCVSADLGPGLILPMGSYLAHLDLSSIYYSGGQFHSIENGSRCNTSN